MVPHAEGFVAGGGPKEVFGVVADHCQVVDVADVLLVAHQPLERLEMVAANGAVDASAIHHTVDFAEGRHAPGVVSDGVQHLSSLQAPDADGTIFGPGPQLVSVPQQGQYAPSVAGQLTLHVPGQDVPHEDRVVVAGTDEGRRKRQDAPDRVPVPRILAHELPLPAVPAEAFEVVAARIDVPIAVCQAVHSPGMLVQLLQQLGLEVVHADLAPTETGPDRTFAQ
mmetsp:Transcript_19325/g.34222  ORF Transcript_19325/g.34222 Transcript_19325/m.34222 type:complete len:224 (+) Transcript_19325:2156-2827(+)